MTPSTASDPCQRLAEDFLATARERLSVLTAADRGLVEIKSENQPSTRLLLQYTRRDAQSLELKGLFHAQKVSGGTSHFTDMTDLGRDEIPYFKTLGMIKSFWQMHPRSPLTLVISTQKRANSEDRTPTPVYEEKKYST